MGNFMTYANAHEMFQEVGNRIKSIQGAYIARGNNTFANLPTVLTEAMSGFVYNVTDEFTTTALFVEGAGTTHEPGSNVAVVDLSTYAAATPAGSENPRTENWYEQASGRYIKSADTEVESGKTYYIKTLNLKYDVLGSFIDMTELNNRIAAIEGMIAGEFEDTEPYVIGTVVMHENKLYKFKAAHTAGDWDATEVDEKTVAQLIQEAEPEGFTTAQVNALIALLD